MQLRFDPLKVSSSAFEKSLNNNLSLDPGRYGATVDPGGEGRFHLILICNLVD